MRRTAGIRDILPLVPLLLLLAPAPLRANPVFVEIGVRDLAPPFLLEAIIIALLASPFGFSLTRTVFAWLIINAFTWVGLVLLLNALSHIPGMMPAGIFLGEAAVCLVEAGILLACARAKLLRPRAAKTFRFPAALGVSVVGNVASLAVGFLVLILRAR